MTNTKKKLGISIFTLVVALVIATSSTFAWFTMNPEVQIGNFNVQVTTGNDDLYVAVAPVDADAQTIADLVYTTSINGADIEAAAGNVRLTALTPNADNSGLREQDSNTDVTYSSSALDTAPNKYFSFDLYFRTTSTKDVTVKLKKRHDEVTEGSESGTFFKEGKKGYIQAWETLTGAEYGITETIEDIAEGTSFTVDPVNALRIGFDPSQTKDDTQVTKIWNPGYGMGYSSAVDDTTGTYVDGKKNLAEEFNKFMKPNAGTQPFVEKEHKTFMQTVNHSGEAPAELDDTVIILDNLDQDTGFRTGKVTVKIWLEGTDGDCFNALYRAAFSMGMQFYIPTSEA